jgi:hypothetical protein
MNTLDATQPPQPSPELVPMPSSNHKAAPTADHQNTRKTHGLTNSRNKRLILGTDYLSVLLTVWELREASLAALCARHCPNCTTPNGLRRILNRLTEAGALIAKTADVLGQAGRPPYCYSCGSRAAAVLAAELNLPLELVQRRIRQDGQLSELLFSHRALVAEIKLALSASAEAHGYRMTTWLSEEQFRAREEYIVFRRRDGTSRKRFVTPDAFCTIQAGTRIAPLLIEAQLRSKPSHYKKKIDIYNEYISSGIFTNHFHYKSQRILAVTDTTQRAANLKHVVDGLPNARLYWSAGIGDIRGDAIGAPVWFVGGAEERMSHV